MGEVEETGYPQPSTTTPLPSLPTTPPFRVIRVGDRVRVCSNVQPPEYGWGSVSHSSIGTVREVQEGAARSGEDKLKVDFSGHSGWNGDRSEMEVVGNNGGGSFKGSRCTGGSSRPTTPRGRHPVTPGIIFPTPETGRYGDSRSGKEIYWSED